MGYPYLIGLSATASGTGGLSVAWPSGHASNDVALLFVETSGSDSVITPPTGWSAVTGSPLVDVATSSGSRFYAWWMRATSAAMPNASVADSGDHQTAKMLVYRNCVASGDPWVDVQTSTWNTSAGSRTLPGVTSTTDQALAVFAISRPNSGGIAWFSNQANENLVQLVEVFDNGTNLGNGGGMGLFHGGIATAGSSGTTTVSQLASTTNTAYVIALASGGDGLSATALYSFPSLAPATRRYSMGIFPVTTESGFGGGTIRFLHSSVSSGHTLELGYENLTATEASLIREHYRFRSGSHESFLLSTAAWAGHTSATDLVPTTTRWKYAAPPEETHKRGGLVDVAVSLLSVI